MHRSVPFRLALPLLALLTGCEVGPTYRRPQVEAVPQFRDQARAEAASFADQPWWVVFHDPVLQGLVGEALERNYEVRSAAQRVAEYRARAGIQDSAFYPDVTAGASYSRGRNSDYVAGGGVTGNQIDAQAGFSWELDLWGRLRRLDEAARAQYLASRDVRRGVFLATAAQVAQAYFELRALDARLEIARSDTRAFQATLDLVDQRFQAGVASSLETAEAEAALADAAAAVPDLESQIRAQENLLSFLVGRAPGPIARGADLGAQPLPPQLPAGIPSALLERRPDLRQAEQELVAANAMVGVAQANYFPTLSLSGLLGGVSPQLDELFGRGKEWNLGPGLALPPLQGARLKYQKAAAVAQWEQARTRYEESVAGAFRDVSTLLTAHQKLAELEVQRTRSATARQDAVRLATERYRNGIADYSQVLDAQQQLLPAQDSLVAVRLARLVNMVRIYEALGGGWNLKDPGDPGAWRAAAENPPHSTTLAK